MCIGNKQLAYDGRCLSLLNRKNPIPAGTYTSITLDENGCIIEAGTAPLPQYTPQACCEHDDAAEVEALLDKIANSEKLKAKLKAILGG
jgi:hypothetical protein